ncbi:MAG TPA: hypothetical protein VGN57_16980 [Pirellulaceae bacterium]|jgi:hypothetical protein|nr:hypothetical protein [Pirellulaceae bacterium]
MAATRRRFLQATGGAAAIAGLGDLGFLSSLPSVSAEEAQLDPKVVRFDPSIEPTVRLIEETPRDRLLEEMGARIKNGLSYQEVLAALLLAGVRNVQPRPSVGHKFHAVLVVNSAHLASLASPPEHRWLPIFWALDYYKSSEARDVQENNWTMGPVDESKLPHASASPAAFVEAMDSWDDAQADAAVASLARSAGVGGIYELFFRYGLRDFRSIGHKAIYVANSRRTLEVIGKQHAEPVLRSLAYALLMHEGGNPAQRDDAADRPFRRNQGLVKQIRREWQDGKLDDEATKEMLAALRTGSNEATCDLTVELLNRGVAAQSVWDAQLVAAGELLMKQPGIVALHAVTTSNAAKYAFDAAADDETRRMLLLQNAAFLPMFRDSLGSRGNVRDVTIDSLEPGDANSGEGPAVDEIFAHVGEDTLDAANLALAYLKRGNSPEALIDAARVLTFLKGDDAHDYKFSSAVLEDYYHVSPGWRNYYLATNVYKLQSTQRADNDLVQRTRAALG